MMLLRSYACAYIRLCVHSSMQPNTALTQKCVIIKQRPNVLYFAQNVKVILKGYSYSMETKSWCAKLENISKHNIRIQCRHITQAKQNKIYRFLNIHLLYWVLSEETTFHWFQVYIFDGYVITMVGIAAVFCEISTGQWSPLISCCA